MADGIIEFKPRGAHTEIEFLGWERETGAPIYWLNYFEAESAGGGVARGVWDGPTLASAIEAAAEWEMPSVIHPSARAQMN